jgi:hypothetical protein
MNIGAILAGTALLVLVVAYVARPLSEKASGGNGRRMAGLSPQAQLIARRDAIYALIRELDADYQTGKVNAGDYQAQRKRYVAEGVTLLKQLDALSDKNRRAALETEIEAAVVVLRQAHPVPQVARHKLVDRFCTRCGHPATLEDNFCSRCGTRLKRTAFQ